MTISESTAPLQDVPLASSSILLPASYKKKQKKIYYFSCKTDKFR